MRSIRFAAIAVVLVMVAGLGFAAILAAKGPNGGSRGAHFHFRSKLPRVFLLGLLALAPLLLVGAGSEPTAPARHGPHVPGEVLVKFRPGTNQRDIAQLNATNGATVASTIPQLGVLRLRASTGVSEEKVAAAYRGNRNVEFAEPNYIATVADTTPNDPLYASDQWGPQKVQAPAAWDITTGSASVVVAVIDTGVSATHPDLAGKVIAGYDFVNSDGDPSDDHGHGTQVAGIIGAASNNGAGVAAIAWQSPILAIKVLDAGGGGSYANVAGGITYAADNGAKVINLSLGGSTESAVLEDAVNYAWNRGAVVVAAAGNTGNAFIKYPARYANAVAAGSTGQTDEKSPFSSYGGALDVMAPGESILSTTLINSYAASSGTSFSAPHVAAAAALLWAKGASSNSAIVDALYRGADDLGTAGWDESYGWGRLNIYRSLVVLGSAPPPTQTPTPTLTPTLTPTPTGTPVASVTPTPTSTPTLTPTVSPTLTPTLTPTATPTPAPLIQETFTGGVGTRGNQMPGADHVITVAARGTISAGLAWKGSGFLRLEVHDPNGNLVASATAGASPQSLDYAAPGAGRYTLGVIAVTGSGKYTLNVLHP